MGSIQKSRKKFTAIEILRGKVIYSEIPEVVSEMQTLQNIGAYGICGFDEKLKHLGIDQELAKKIYSKDLTKEELKQIINELKASSKIGDLFTNTEKALDVLEDEDFKSLKEAISIVDLEAILQEKNGNVEMGNHLKELLSYCSGFKGTNICVASESLRKLIVKMNSLEAAESIYNPAIGAGILTMEVAQANEIPYIYGYEMEQTAAKFCKMLLIAYGLVEQAANIQVGNVFLQDLKMNNIGHFDKVVCELPFGLTLTEETIEQLIALYPGRWSRTLGEMAYIYHAYDRLNAEGMASLIVSNGVLFRGGAEAEMRQKLLEENCIACIIQLPNKMFTHTSIPTALMILKKNRSRKDVLFMDLTGEVNKVSRLVTQLSEETIQKAFDLYKNYENSGISRSVAIEEILNNESNLTVKRYIGTEEKEAVDLDEINQTITALEQELRMLQEKIKSKL